MILPTGSTLAASAVPWWPAVLSAALYLVAALPWRQAARLAVGALLAAWLVHLLALVLDIAGVGAEAPGARLGFAPVLSITVWLVIALHAVESRFVPLPKVRRWLSPVGAVVVLLALAFPGDPRQFSSPMAPLHFALGVAAYGLFGAAVLHAAMLDGAERRMRRKQPGKVTELGMPLLQLERLTFRLVEAGFVVLSATLLLGALTPTQWRWTHKTWLSLLGWAVFAGLIAGRHLRGWRGRRATRWLYAGAVLLLLAYVGYRFTLEVVLGRKGV